jgi:hypothetical protein
MSESVCYAVVDRHGIVLATWESHDEPQQRRAKRRGELRVRRTPGATGWAAVEGGCEVGDRLAFDEWGGATVTTARLSVIYSAYYFRLGDLIYEAEDANEHPLARVLDQVRLLYSAGRIVATEELLRGPADEMREVIRAATG